MTLTPLFVLARLMFDDLFALALALLLLLALSFVFFGLGRLGLFSLVLDAGFVLRLSVGSSGVTVSGVSPSLAARLISIATV